MFLILSISFDFFLEFLTPAYFVHLFLQVILSIRTFRILITAILNTQSNIPAMSGSGSSPVSSDCLWILKLYLNSKKKREGCPMTWPPWSSYLSDTPALSLQQYVNCISDFPNWPLVPLVTCPWMCLLWLPMLTRLSLQYWGKQFVLYPYFSFGSKMSCLLFSPFSFSFVQMKLPLPSHLHVELEGSTVSL